MLLVANHAMADRCQSWVHKSVSFKDHAEVNSLFISNHNDVIYFIISD